MRLLGLSVLVALASGTIYETTKPAETTTTVTDSTTTTTSETTTESTTTSTTTTETTTTTTTTATTTTASTTTSTTTTTTTTTTSTTTSTATTTTTVPTTTTPSPCEAWKIDGGNSSWVFQSSKNDTLFLADTSFRVFTSYMNNKHKGSCPWAFSFDLQATNTSAQNKSIDGDFALYVTLDASKPTKNITQRAVLTFLEHKDTYYLNGAQVWYSENMFPHGSGDDVKTIMVEGLKNFPTPKVQPIHSCSFLLLFQNSSHACNYPAEIQLNVTDTSRYGFQMNPANWEAFSDFGSRTKLKNPDHCPADNVATTAQSKLSPVLTVFLFTIIIFKRARGTSPHRARTQLSAVALS